ncbi:unnamed protein product [Amaranthus hypochondriacus]
MSTQNQANQHGVIQSSIVLLQERFKQLQRVKEMREKKELLRLFSTVDSPNNSIIINDDHDHDDDLQIFLPPNYYYNRTKPSSLSSSLSHNHNNYNNNNNNNNNNNLNEISLSLWPPTMSTNNNATSFATGNKEDLRREINFDAPIATISSRMPSSCISSAYKLEDCQHVSEVDTTLHL